MAEQDRTKCPFNNGRLCLEIKCVFWAEAGSCKWLDILGVVFRGVNQKDRKEILKRS